MNWPELIIEELLRCGVDRFFIAPGSRSTPLVSAIARNKRALASVHFDERGTAFAALGYARSTQNPAVWVTTSGTAVANGFPAVVEASMDDIPMILLTADRPPELRDTGANQTIHQTGIFGDYVRWSFEFPVPDERTDASFVLTTVDQAVHRSRSESGPVHLNCQFRKPLESDPADSSSGVPNGLESWHASNRAYTEYGRVVSSLDESGVENFKSIISEARRPVIILGRTLHTQYEDTLISWAEKEGIPVLPDISSTSRVTTGDSNVIHFWDLVTAVSEGLSRLQPDLIIQFGRGTVSTAWSSIAARRVVIDAGRGRYDPGHRVTLRLTASAQGVIALLDRVVGQFQIEQDWLADWQTVNSVAEDLLNEWLRSNPDLVSEEILAHVVPSSCEPGCTLVLGNSLSVRNANRYCRPTDQPLSTVLNRGASGIDGTVAIAAGVFAGTGKRVVVLLGDQSLLYDLNSLSMIRDVPITVVVINNRGGRIFHRLPVAGHTDIFERYFVVPHELTFEYAARQFGLDYRTPDSIAAFRKDCDAAAASSSGTLIEVCIDFENAERERVQFETTLARRVNRLPGGPVEP